MLMTTEPKRWPSHSAKNTNERYETTVFQLDFCCTDFPAFFRVQCGTLEGPVHGQWPGQRPATKGMVMVPSITIGQEWTLKKGICFLLSLPCLLVFHFEIEFPRALQWRPVLGPRFNGTCCDFQTRGYTTRSRELLRDNRSRMRLLQPVPWFNLHPVCVSLMGGWDDNGSLCKHQADKPERFITWMIRKMVPFVATCKLCRPFISCKRSKSCKIRTPNYNNQDHGCPTEVSKSTARVALTM